MSNFRWRRSDYGPKSIGLMVQVLRDELFQLERECYLADGPKPENVSDTLSRIKTQMDLIEKFMGSCIEPVEKS